MDLKGKGAVVVGGASGMARATVERLTAGGARVAILDLPTSGGAEVASAIGGDTINTASITAFPHRMGKPDEYAKLAVAIVENSLLNGFTIRLDAAQRFQPK